MARRVAEAFAALERESLLLHADPVLPSVTSLVAGEPVRGSWWGHPAGHAIFAVLTELAGSDQATSVKLVNGKQTLVHRSPWPALARIGGSGSIWQTTKLPAVSKELLVRVERLGTLGTDELGSKAEKAAARELEKRLLIHAHQIHTDSGAHAQVLASWDSWLRQTGSRKTLCTVPNASLLFEEVADGWRERFGSRIRLPCQ